MSDRYTRITVPLSKDEFEALRDAANREYRHPREQARFILRQALLGNGNVDVPVGTEKEIAIDLERF